jgi:hypothetical protein
MPAGRRNGTGVYHRLEGARTWPLANGGTTHQRVDLSGVGEVGLHIRRGTRRRRVEFRLGEVGRDRLMPGPLQGRHGGPPDLPPRTRHQYPHRRPLSRQTRRRATEPGPAARRPHAQTLAPHPSGSRPEAAAPRYTNNELGGITPVHA